MRGSVAGPPCWPEGLPPRGVTRGRHHVSRVTAVGGGGRSRLCLLPLHQRQQPRRFERTCARWGNLDSGSTWSTTVLGRRPYR